MHIRAPQRCCDQILNLLAIDMARNIINANPTLPTCFIYCYTTVPAVCLSSLFAPELLISRLARRKNERLRRASLSVAHTARCSQRSTANTQTPPSQRQLDHQQQTYSHTPAQQTANTANTATLAPPLLAGTYVRLPSPVCAISFACRWPAGELTSFPSLSRCLCPRSLAHPQSPRFLSLSLSLLPSLPSQ